LSTEPEANKEEWASSSKTRGGSGGASKFGFHCNLLGFLVKSSLIYWLGALNYFFQVCWGAAKFFSRKDPVSKRRLKNTSPTLPEHSGSHRNPCGEDRGVSYSGYILRVCCNFGPPMGWNV